MKACMCGMCGEQDRTHLYTFDAEDVLLHPQDDLENPCSEATRPDPATGPAQLPDRARMNTNTAVPKPDSQVFATEDMDWLVMNNDKKIRARALRSVGTRNRSAVDDIVQEVYLRLAAKLKKEPTKFVPGPYLDRITTNVVSDYWLALNKRREVSDENHLQKQEAPDQQKDFWNAEAITRWTKFVADSLRDYQLPADLPLGKFTTEDETWLAFCEKLEKRSSEIGRVPRLRLDTARILGRCVAALANLDDGGNDRSDWMIAILNQTLGSPNWSQSKRRGWKHLRTRAEEHGIERDDDVDGSES